MSRIKNLRKQAGLPIEVLAYRAGCSPRAVYMLEKWGIPPKRRETLEKIARALGVEPDDLLQESKKEVSEA